jgi:acetylglutamate kinase
MGIYRVYFQLFESREKDPRRGLAFLFGLLFLTDVPGVLDKNKQLIKELSVAQIRALIADGTITGGMIPKVETCIYAIEQGVEGVVILDGKTPHAVLVELLTDGGAGTLITR